MTITAQSDLKATLALSLFFTGVQQAMQAARTVAELAKAGAAMDDPTFEALPPSAREDLAALYAHRLMMLTGALVP